MNRFRQTIHKVYQFFKTGHNALDYFNQYKKNKTRCGRRPIVLSDEQTEYIQKRVVQGWAPDVIGVSIKRRSYESNKFYDR
ncbi:hypothetical protein RV17_GL001657 [Enterococcus thailandicus]|nr:hypothetical protein RV17_GL001657 [Enterococcus thailandicus]